MLVTTAGCRQAREAETVAGESREPPLLQAEVFTVEPQPWPQVVRTQGSLISEEVTTVGAKVAGRVVEVVVDLGDRVNRGDPMVLLDRQEFQLMVTQANAQLAQARAAVGLKPEEDVATLDPLGAPPVREARAVWEQSRQQLVRVKQLKVQNAVSDAELQQAEAAERVAEARYASAVNTVREKMALIGVQAAELALAQQRYEDAITRAPFDATVQNRLVAPGTYVQVGEPLMALVTTTTLRFRGAMPERYAQSLRVGQRVVLQIESLADPRTVQVTRISPALDEASRALVFEAQVENQDEQLRTGLFAEAEVVLDPEARSIVIPASAVVRFAGVEKVWKVVDEMAGPVPVQVGQQKGDRVEILEGLSQGDVILSDGSQGRVARIRRSSSAASADAPAVATQ
jgi:RND family efflux transporter MFP subunit